MSGLAKIFLVINLVLAVLLLGTSATLFSVRKDWKLASEKLQAEYEQTFQKQLDTLKKLRDKLQVWTYIDSTQHAEIVNLRAENAKLTSQLDQLSRELASTKTELDKSKATVGQQNTQITTLSEQVQSLTTTLAQTRKAAEDANAKAEKATTRYNSEFLEKTQLEEQIKSLNEEVAQLRLENEQLKIKINLVTTVGPGGTAQPLIQAKITGVRGDVAILSVGEEDKVQPGMTFMVYRDGQYLGDVKVEAVYKNMSGARITHLLPGAEIRGGDDARTKQF